MNKAISTSIAIAIVLIVFAISIGLILLGYMCWPKLEIISEEENNQAQDETADWKTYRNEEYGFEIKYPENYTVGKIMAENNEFVTFSVDNLQIVISATGLSLDDFVRDKVQGYVISNCQKISFLEKDAYEGINQGITNTYEVLIKNKGYIYELIFKTNNKDTLQELKAGLTIEQNQILSTFRLIDVVEESISGSDELDFYYELYDDYFHAKELLEENGWESIIPEQYENGLNISEDPIFEEFPEIRSCGSGKDAICNVDFVKTVGSQKYYRHLNLQSEYDEEENLVWIVVGSE